MAASLAIENVSFSYDQDRVLRDVTLRVEPGRTLALIGPSGSGKSTLLSILAGLASPSHGQVSVDDNDVTNVAPERRGMGVVFQDYALFPSLSAVDNIAFGPRQRNDTRADATRWAHELGTQLEVGDVLEHRPAELSGGQQQRVALARALAIRPRVLLLDEPLSNVDPALRARVRVKLREWLRHFQTTSVLVTHDREDAFWLADDLGVLLDGRLAQVGTPHAVYTRPNTGRVAELLGPVNRVPLAGSSLATPEAAEHWGLIRPEDLQLDEESRRGVPARVRQRVHLGSLVRVQCELEGGVTVWVNTEHAPDRDHVGIVLPANPWCVGPTAADS